MDPGEGLTCLVPSTAWGICYSQNGSEWVVEFCSLLFQELPQGMVLEPGHGELHHISSPSCSQLKIEEKQQSSMPQINLLPASHPEITAGNMEEVCDHFPHTDPCLGTAILLCVCSLQYSRPFLFSWSLSEPLSCRKH